MKRLLVASIFFWAGSTLAQSNFEFKEVPKIVACGPVASIIRALTGKDIGETPVFIGQDEGGRSNYAVFMNAKTGSFTIIQFSAEVACILGSGHKSEKF